MRNPKRKARRSKRQPPRTNPEQLSLVIDGQRVPQRMTRGRKTKFVRRVLRGFRVESCESCAMWEEAQHLLFWELLGYDGRYYSWVHGLPGMIGESKRLIQEAMR